MNDPASDPLHFRPATADDEPIIERAHAEHRGLALAGAGWPAGTLADMCRQQYLLQQHHITVHHPQIERRAILIGDALVGQLCLDRGADPWLLVDLVILPEAQRRGHARTALRQLMAEAMQAAVSIELSVGIDSPGAAALYRALGFHEPSEAAGCHRRMRWPPAMNDETVDVVTVERSLIAADPSRPSDASLVKHMLENRGHGERRMRQP